MLSALLSNTPALTAACADLTTTPTPPLTYHYPTPPLPTTTTTPPLPTTTPTPPLNYYNF